MSTPALGSPLPAYGGGVCAPFLPALPLLVASLTPRITCLIDVGVAVGRTPPGSTTSAVYGLAADVRRRQERHPARTVQADVADEPLNHHHALQ